MSVDNVYPELQKAFDYVLRNKVMFKVKQFGIIGNVCNCIEISLNNRKPPRLTK